MEQVREQTQPLAAMLVERELKIATGESCTGGLVAAALTEVPGSSMYFTLGVVAYTPEQKRRLLMVPEDVLDEYGAVSEEVCRAMLRGIRRLSRADVCIAVTGYAGPGGGTPDKPVGSVFIGVSYQSRLDVRMFRFAGSRRDVRRLAVKTALEMTKDLLISVDFGPGEVGLG